jgi:positive control factor
MEEMIDRYKHTRRRLRALRTLNTDKTERQIIGEMISDCEYTLEWLQSGRRPGNRRGIERRAAYQREKLIDPIRIQAFVSKNTAGSPANLSEWQRTQLEDALSRLSGRERECYILAHGECFSFAEIADLLKITKASVETYVNRAQQKISENLNSSLFLLMG